MNKFLVGVGCAVVAATMVLAEDKPAERKPEQRGMRAQFDAGMMDRDFQMLPMMHRDIDLTKEQQQQLKGIIAGSTNEMRTLNAKMEAAAKAQGALLSQDTPDEAAVLKGADEIAALRAEIARIRIKQVLAAQKLLTPEQRAKMREKMKERMEKRPMAGERRRAEGLKKEQDKPAATPVAPKAE